MADFVPYTPFLPPMNPYAMPPGTFDAIISAYGVRLSWQKSHLCPCVYGGGIAGSPDNQCQTCLGRGWYWDAPSSPFVGLITFMHLAPSPDEPGAVTDEKWGMMNRGEPVVTLGATTGSDINVQTVYTTASLNDIFTELDTSDRFESELQVGGIQSVPYQQNVSIAASGAVTIYDPINHIVTPVTGYVVSGATVTLPGSYVSGTAYVVEYFASKSYVAYRHAGATAHERPFGSGLKQPRRFRLQLLDLWLRGSGKI